MFCLLFILVCKQVNAQSVDSFYFSRVLNTFAKGSNHHRYCYLRDSLKAKEDLHISVRTEPIDWFGIYRNVIVDIRGESDSTVYLVAHYDKVDGNVLQLPGLVLLGHTDILASNIYLSNGAYDNGTGVAILLSMIKTMQSRPMHYSYRFLFTGLEEFGLRGSRTHISQLSLADYKKIFYAINIDMVGATAYAVPITYDVSDSSLVKKAITVCDTNRIAYVKAAKPKGGLSDYYSFKGQSFGKDLRIAYLASIVGILIPQRSYFTQKKAAVPVIDFSDPFTFSAADYASALLPVSFGKVHSFRDNERVIKMGNLVQFHEFLWNYINVIDRKGI